MSPAKRKEVQAMKRLRWWEYLTINIYWLGLNVSTGSQSTYILPWLVLLLVGEGMKNTALGFLSSAGLVVAILVQAAAGLLSDRSTARWGRRRPFIVTGTLLDMVFLVLIGLAGLYWKSYWLLFAAVLLIQFSSNIAHGALQGLIPDLVPEDQRGRASGVKAMFELLPVILVGFTIARIVEKNTWLAIFAVMASLLLGMLFTLPVREQPLPQKPETPLWPSLENKSTGEKVAALAATPLGRVVLLTAIFTVVTALFGGLIGFVGKALEGWGTVQLGGVALAGLVAMAGAIILGVWWSARVGIGEGARKNPSFTWWVINRLLFLAGVGSIRNFALYFLRDVLHMPNAAVATGNLMIVVGIFTFLSALFSGFLADVFGRKALVAGSGVLAALGTILLILSPNMTMVMISGVIIGIAAGTFMTVNWALGTDLVPPEEAGRYLGISNLAGAGAGIVGTGLGGPMADFFNAASPGLGYLVIFGLYAALFLLSAVLLVRVPERWRPGQAAA
jgi:MFS family permease